jgi:hypothetical protein
MTDYSEYQHINTKTSEFIYELSLLRVFFRGEDTDYLDLVLDKKVYKFYYYADPDDLNYEEEVKKQRNIRLIVYTQPITIYETPNFNKPLCEEKYRNLVQDLTTKNGKTWEDIVKIVKLEERIEGDKVDARKFWCKR